MATWSVLSLNRIGSLRKLKEELKAKVKVDGRCEGGPEEDGCHKLEDMCTQKRRLEDGREGGQGPTRTVEPWNSSSSSSIRLCLKVV